MSDYFPEGDFYKKEDIDDKQGSGKKNKKKIKKPIPFEDTNPHHKREVHLRDLNKMYPAVSFEIVESLYYQNDQDFDKTDKILLEMSYSNQEVIQAPDVYEVPDVKQKPTVDDLCKKFKTLPKEMVSEIFDQCEKDFDRAESYLRELAGPEERKEPEKATKIVYKEDDLKTTTDDEVDFDELFGQGGGMGMGALCRHLSQIIEDAFENSVTEEEMDELVSMCGENAL
jgi:hypothetical protein